MHGARAPCEPSPASAYTPRVTVPPDAGSATIGEPRWQRPSPADLDEGVRGLGYEAFRPGQREAIETLLDRGRLLLVAPTGDTACR